MIRLTPDQQKKGAAFAGFAVLAVGILYYELRDDSPQPVAAPVVVTAPAQTAPAAKTGTAGRVTGRAAKNLGTTSAQLDPTLRMQAMLVTESLVYSGSGRNIFLRIRRRWIFLSRLRWRGQSQGLHHRRRHLRDHRRHRRSI